MSERSALIVVGIDGAPASRRALAWALAEARTWQAPLAVVHAWDVRPHGVLHWDRPEAAQHLAGQLVESEVAAAVAGDERDRPIVIETVTQGPVANVLVDAARPASLLVVGSSRRPRESVGAECARRAACPVVVVPP